MGTPTVEEITIHYNDGVSVRFTKKRHLRTMEDLEANLRTKENLITARDIEIAELTEILEDKRTVMAMQREEIAELKEQVKFLEDSDIVNKEEITDLILLKDAAEMSFDTMKDSKDSDILMLNLRIQSAANELEEINRGIMGRDSLLIQDAIGRLREQKDNDR